MSKKKRKKITDPVEAERKDPAREPPPAVEDRPREVGGREGPDPTRYGDWEKAGRCIDF